MSPVTPLPRKREARGGGEGESWVPAVPVMTDRGRDHG